MNWPLSPGNRGQKHSQKRSSFSKSADSFSFSLTARVCVPFFVGLHVMNSPQSTEVSWDSSEIARRRQLRVAAFHGKLDKAGSVFVASALRK